MNNNEERSQIAVQGQGYPNPNHDDLEVENWNALSKKNFANNQANAMVGIEDYLPSEVPRL